MTQYREIFIGQGAQNLTRMLADRVRRPKPVNLDDLAEPDRPALRAAEQLVQTGAPAEGDSALELAAGPILFPDQLFAQIEDREAAKLVLQKAIQSRRPVHVLLVGSPASGKSQLLQAVATLPRARYAVGGATSSSGLISYLLERPTTQILIIDELDKADPADLYALYSLMESGMVTRLQHNASEQHIRRVRVFAAANTADKLPGALLSRFVKVSLEPYTAEQLRAINLRVIEREGHSPARAKAIAEAVGARSNDPRDARDVARLADADGEFDSILEQVIPPKARKSG